MLGSADVVTCVVCDFFGLVEWCEAVVGRSGRRRRRALLAVRGAAELPRREARDDSDDDGDDDQRAEEADAAEARARPGEARGDERRLVGPGEAAVVLLDVEIAVEAEVVGIRAQESLDVRVSGRSSQRSSSSAWR